MGETLRQIEAAEAYANVDAIEQMRKALKTATTALNDWLHIYADDMCREEDVAAAKARIRAQGGTLGYITNTLEAIRSVQALSGNVRAASNGASEAASNAAYASCKDEGCSEGAARRTAIKVGKAVRASAGCKEGANDLRSEVDELTALKSSLENAPLILRQVRYLLRDYAAKGGFPGLMPDRLEHIADTIQGFTPRPIPQQAATPDEFRTELALLLLQRHPDFDYDNASLADAQAYADRMLTAVEESPIAR